MLFRLDVQIASFSLLFHKTTFELIVIVRSQHKCFKTKLNILNLFNSLSSFQSTSVGSISCFFRTALSTHTHNHSQFSYHILSTKLKLSVVSLIFSRRLKKIHYISEEISRTNCYKQFSFLLRVI